MDDLIIFPEHRPVEFLVGDSREVLKTLTKDSFQSCITSPPYYAARNYNHDQQIGRESTPDDYINELVKIFAEVRRVLRPDGTVWINIGDVFASSPPGNVRGVSDKSGLIKGNKSESYRDRLTAGMGTKMDTSRLPGIPKKSLLLIPCRLALALQADDWIVRQNIVWENPSGCESVNDRPSLSHEYVLMLSRSQKYKDAVREPSGANCRSVWKIPSVPFKGAHFATMPPSLVERCMMASTLKDDLVLDPFGGAGTTGLIAKRLGRGCTMIELNPEYAEIGRKRIEND